jgi:beta-lactam-binding protein with PASTA domain
MRACIHIIRRGPGRFRIQAPTVFVCLMLTGLALFPLGCGYARLDGALADNRRIGKDEPLRIQIVRDGEQVPPRLGLDLKKGDDIETPAGITAFLQFQDGSQVIMMPETGVQIRSIRVKFGKIIAFVRAQFRAKTQYVEACAESTVFIVEVGATAQSTITMIEGSVALTSPQGLWRSVSLRAGQQARAGRGESPRIEVLPQEAYNDAVRSINDLLRRGGRTGDAVVPDVRQLHQDGARQVLQSAGFAVGALVPTIDGQYPVNTVVRQQPGPGARVRPGSAVALWVQASATTVPSVVGRPLREARDALRQAGLRAPEGAVPPTITGEYPSGVVNSQLPGPGQRVAEGTAVRLTVEAESVVVPNLTGVSMEAAAQMAKAQGFPISRREAGLQARLTRPQVVRQEPAPGTRVQPGTTVSLYCAVPGTAVPSLLGTPNTEAPRILAEARLKTGSIARQPSPDHDAGVIISQSPPPGQMVEYGSAVNLTVSTGRTAVADRGARTPSAPRVNLTVARVAYDWRSSQVTYSLNAQGRLPASINMAIQVQPRGSTSRQVATWPLSPKLIDQLNQGITITDSHSIPRLSEGQNTITVIVDVDNRIVETDEQDNRTSTTVNLVG